MLRLKFILGLILIFVYYNLIIDIAKSQDAIKFERPEMMKGVQIITITGHILNKYMFHSDMFKDVKPKINLDAIKITSKNVYVIIDSPGGSVDAGVNFLKRVQEEGATLTCLVDGRAFSTALYIFSNCDTRLSTTGSKVSWHSASILLPQGQYSEKDLKRLHDSMLEANQMLWKRVRPFFPTEFFNKIFNTGIAVDVKVAETYGFLNVID